jgi:hypothetical protein
MEIGSSRLNFINISHLGGHDGVKQHFLMANRMKYKIYITVNREIFAALKFGEFAFFQLAVDKIPRLNG